MWHVKMMSTSTVQTGYFITRVANMTGGSMFEIPTGV